MHVRYALITLATIAAVGVAIAWSGAAKGIGMRSADDRVRVSVAYSDVDLGSPSGARAVLGRIRGAAEQICDQSHATLEARAQYRACLDAVTRQAVTQLGSPLVTALNGPAKGGSNVILSASR